MIMSSRKKSTTSTDSSSNTSSGTSSSSDTSSGTDSNTSSSDSDSSSSPEATPSSRRNSSSGASNHNATPNDPKPTANGTKKPNPPAANAAAIQPQRRVSDAKTSKSTQNSAPMPAQSDKMAPGIGAPGSNKIKPVPTKTAISRSIVKAADLSNSSEDDSLPSKVLANPKKPAETKKKTAPLAQRAKTTAAHNANNSIKSSSVTSVTTVPPSTGGKAPPAVVKQQQQQLHGLAKSNAKKAGSGNIKAKPPIAKIHPTAPPSKAHPPANAVASNTSSKSTIDKTGTHKTGNTAPDDEHKKKSIFSPDNSTDTDDDDGSDGSDDDDTDNDLVNNKKTNNLASKPKSSSAAATVLVGGKTKPPIRPKGRPPPPKPKVVEKQVEKSSAESSAASTSTSTDDATSSSESDSEESSADSSPPSKRPPNRRVPPKSTATRPAINKNSSESKDNANSESDIDNKSDQTVVRKLTRSSSTRKSKHLTAIFNPGKVSESETESETKRSTTKSPVKRAPTSKGKSKNSKTNSKNSHSPVKRTPTIPEERHCMVDGCNSLGHLGGHLEKHFTEEACPLFHGVSLADTKINAEEHVKREEERKKAMILFDPDKKQVTVEQKSYQMKIKDIRNKFTPAEVSPDSPPVSLNHFREREYREPSLAGLVSDYDLQMFREAQAVASEKIEEELKDLPAGKGTKYILMGRHNMEVWYQSPYPDDAARLPKLYLCEFCLRYQKSEVGMKRHAAKCVWRHPPGDEIYRKQKLGVWQVDGKRHKQYCQHLCLLAKFFLDHKTLYYDVEPFLFYVMTLADAEGCHTVGYFSKEKNSFLNYNVSCILTLPPYQRKGYGRLLIDFSYLLTRVENKIGSPEKPLSDLGLISYRSYWKDVLLDYLCSRSGTSLSIKDVSQEMAINSYDIVSTLQALGMMKYWKGKHIILKKQDVLEEYAERIKSRGAVIKIDPTCLRWTPFVLPAPPGPS